MYKRITLEDRINILAGIIKQVSLKQIASRIDKEESNVIRETLSNSRIVITRKSCEHCKKVCLLKTNYVNGQCSEFEEIPCTKRDSFRYVCNGCIKSRECKSFKRYYDFKYANNLATKRLVNTRRGRRLSVDEIKIIDEEITPRIKRVRDCIISMSLQQTCKKFVVK